MVGLITSSGVNNEIHIEWKIPNFFKKRDQTIESPIFNIFEFKFNLVLCIEEFGYLSMHLSSFNDFEINAEFSMGIKKINLFQLRTNNVEYLLSPVGTTPTFKLISAKKLFCSLDIIGPDDCLTVFCNFHLINKIIDFQKTSCMNPSFSGTATSSDSGVNEAISVLTENFKDLYLKKSCADITIKVKSKEFLVHKAILVARSEVFASMFQHDSPENRSSIVEITDCDPESFEDFLLFLYTANLKLVESKNVVSLYMTSDKYGCKELLKECVQCMVRELCVDMFCDYFQLATLHNESNLLTATINFFIKNANEIFRTTKWVALMKEHPSLCNELIIKYSDVH